MTKKKLGVATLFIVLASCTVEAKCFWENRQLPEGREGRVQFWIIDAREHVIHGPMDRAEFNQMREHRNVPKDLRLIDR